jgi:hypothetical protein
MAQHFVLPGSLCDMYPRDPNQTLKYERAVDSRLNLAIKICPNILDG